MMDTLIRLSEDWLPLYAVHMLETSLFVLLVWALDRWVSLDTRLRYSLWLCALVKVFVPPFYALPLPSILFGSPEPVAPVVPFADPVFLSAPIDFTPIALPPEPIPAAFWVFVLWSVSVLGFVGVTLRRNRVFQRALGIANPIQLSNALDDLTQGAKLKVFSKANLSSPLLVGVVNPRLYLPATWQAWTPTQLRGIVAHELAHYHNRDLWALVFQVLATVLFGLNPLIWLVNRRLAHLRELRCDEDALRKSGISPVEYGKLLYAFLDANAHPGLPALGFNEKDTPLKKRFEHVLNFKGGNMKRSKWQLAVPVLVALAVVPFSIRETYSQSQSMDAHAVHLDLGEFVINPPGSNGKKSVSLNVILSSLDGSPKIMIDKSEVKNAVLAELIKVPAFSWEVGSQVVVEDAVQASIKRLLGEQTNMKATIEDLKIDGQAYPKLGELGSVWTQVIFKPLGEQHIKISVDVRIDGATEQDRAILQAKSLDVSKTVHKIVSHSDRDVLYEEGMRFQVAHEVRLTLQRELKVEIKNVKLGEAMAVNELTQMADLWVNYKGDMLLNMNKAVSIGDLDEVFAKLKKKLHTPTLLLRVDRGASQNVTDAILKSAKRAGLEVRPTGLATQLETSVEPETNANAPVLKFFQVDQKPKSLNKVKPIYPMQAKAQGITGKVFVEFIVNTDGSVSNVKVLRGSEKFHQAAIEAALKLKYEPAKHQGHIVPVWMTLPISFRLGGTQMQSWRPFGNSSKANTQVSEIWVNANGRLLIDLSKSLPVGDLQKELADLKQNRNIHTVVIKPDDKAPVDVLKKIFEVGKQAGLRVQMKHYIPPSTGRTNVEIDPDNLEFYQVGVKPKPIYQEAPTYPNIARRAGLVGKVFLKFRVNIDGSVSDVTVLRGKEIFRNAAINAILKSRFKPAEYEGRPVAVWMTQPMNFRLGKKQNTHESKSQTIELGPLLVKVPKGQNDRATIQPQLILNTVSFDAADILNAHLGKAQQMVTEYLSSIPLAHWETAPKRAVILNGIESQINTGFGRSLVDGVTFSGLIEFH